MHAAVGLCPVLNLVVLYDYQKADTDAEKLALTEQLVGCTFAAAAVTSCVVEPNGWIVFRLAVRTNF